MALIRTLNTAVTGLRAQQFRMEVIGHNIANVDTTAYKVSRTEFATILAQTLRPGLEPQGFLGGIDPIQVGLGAKVAQTMIDFSQGPTEATGVRSDLAIDGDGFFLLRDVGGNIVYTRDGSFTLDPTNLLHDASTGFVVQGYGIDSDFNVQSGGPLQDIEIPIGVLTIARATGTVSVEGNLNAGGPVASQGTLVLSDLLFDNRYTNTDLISAANPLGLERATRDTPLGNLVRSLGGYVPFSSTSPGTAGTSSLVFPDLATTPTGVAITVAALKGSRALPERTFVVGDAPPTGGMTLGDFIDYLEGTLGVADGWLDGEERVEHTYSFTRTNPRTGEEQNGTISAGVAGVPDDVITLTTLVDHQADFTGVMAGDYVRFTSGAAAGEVAAITQVSASTPGGKPDTLSLRFDGFNSLSRLPDVGSTYVINAPASVRISEDTLIATVDSSSPTVTVGAVATNGSVSSFTVTDTAAGNFGIDWGVRANQRVEYTSGGATVIGRVTDTVGDTITVSFDAALAQSPDAGTAFSIVRDAEGSILIAGNVGQENQIEGIEVTAGGKRMPLFENPPLISAAGESLTTTLTVYDSLGTPRRVDMTFVYESSSAGGPNVFRYFAESPDDVDGDRLVGSGTVLFNSSGQFLGAGADPSRISIDLGPSAAGPGGMVTPVVFDLDLTRLTGFSDGSQVTMRDQDGFESGALRDFTVGADGTIVGVFSNGLVRNLGQVALGRFPNPNGLEMAGDNLFQGSSNSGEVQVGTPGTFGRGTIRSGYLEESNVDLAKEFTELIIGQRAFQANARTISASDAMLEELVNLL